MTLVISKTIESLNPHLYLSIASHCLIGHFYYAGHWNL